MAKNQKPQGNPKPAYTEEQLKFRREYEKTEMKKLWAQPLPQTVAYTKTTVSFKIAEQDSGKKPSEVIEIDDDRMVFFLSANSYFSGLIMGDKVLKVNSVTEKDKLVAELMKGQTCSVEVTRRKGALPITRERLSKSKCGVKRGHSCFVLEIQRPSNMATTLLGLQLKILKRRAFVVKVDPNTICANFLARGDAIMDMDGTPIPFLDTADNFVRDHLGKLSTGETVSLLVERPMTFEMAKELQKFIFSLIAGEMDEHQMAQDAIDIGQEASNMHFIILKKLKTPSILTSDVKKTKRMNSTRMSEGPEARITISTASTEMKIKSDVEDVEDLKPVVFKSHAAGSSEDCGGAFDDE